MLVLFIALLLLVLAVVAFSGNNDRRRDSYRRRSRYDDYDPYHQPQFPYPHYIEPVWGRSRWEYGGGGDKSAYGFVAIVALGLLAYYVFANDGPGLNKDGPTRETYWSGLNSSNLSSTNKPVTKSVFPPEYTLKKTTTANSSLQPEVYTYDIPGEPADELNSSPNTSTGVELSHGDYYIQTGSFSQLSGAKLEQNRLRELLDKPVRLYLDQSTGFTEFKLLVGPFLLESDARQYKKRNLAKDSFVKVFEDYELSFVD